MNQETSNKYFVGIDPGSTGAISIISTAGKATVVKMPEATREIRYVIHNLVPIKMDLHRYTCEAVHSSPQMGVSTAFKFGRNFGVLEGILAGLDDPVEFVTPQKWQAALNCRTGGNKKVSLEKAKELFPDTKGITLQTADSLLIAYYGYLKYGK